MQRDRKKDVSDVFCYFIEKTGDSTRGIGIGLSICKSIIFAHKGSISAENNKEGGATFRFTLPKKGEDINHGE